MHFADILHANIQIKEKLLRDIFQTKTLGLKFSICMETNV